MRAHGVCDYGTLPIMWQDLTSSLTTFIYKYIRPRVAVFAKKNLIYQFCYRSDLCKDSDIIILDILNSEIPDFQIMNVYNEKSLKKIIMIGHWIEYYHISSHKSI